MSDYSSVENNSAAMAAAIPAATTSTATGAPCSDQMVMVQADYSSAAACYYQQAPMPFAYATAVSESGVSCNYQPPMPHQYYQQEMQMQPPCLYYYPPPPAICGPGQDPMAAAVYGNQGMAPYQGFYQQHPLPPPQHQLSAPAALTQPMQPPPLMQQQPLVVPAPAPLPTSSAPPSSSAGSCPCCSAPLHQQSQQPQLQPPPQPVQQLQLPQQPQPQQLREQSRSSSCDSAYRTVSTSDLASVGDINQHPNLQRQMPQQLLAPPPQQQQWARRNSFQQQQQQQPLPAQQPQQQQQSQQKRWKTGYLRNILYKTEMCRDVAQRGACPRGATCQFAHSDTEVLSPSQHPLYKTAFCFDYKNRGHCQRGDHCFHAHQQVELRPAPPVELQTPPSATGLLRPSQHLQQHLSGSGARRESTPRSLAAGGALASSSGPYKALAARLQQQHQLLQQASGCGSSEKQQSSSLVTSTKQMQFSGSPQQFATAERRLSLSGTAGSRSGF